MQAERLDRFMARANRAYYASRDPFADFTTAPEISQAFGEILGAWAAVVWQSMGRPDPVILAEAGPGRGTLMSDAWRLIRRVAPDFAAASRLHLVESSPRLRALQSVALADAAPAWHEALEDLPNGPTILLANEFLDALEIRQFRRESAGWSERHVQDGAACWQAAEALPAAAFREVPVGGVVEWGEAAIAWTARLASRLASQGGAALLLDYGDDPVAGETLQALSGGAPADPFAAPGEADLTAHVDFAALRRAAGGCVQVYGPEPQGHVLSRLGLFARIERLVAAMPAGGGGALVEAAHRLAGPAAMGRLFKAMALCERSLPPPPGFEPVPSSESARSR